MRLGREGIRGWRRQHAGHVRCGTATGHSARSGIHGDDTQTHRTQRGDARGGDERGGEGQLLSRSSPLRFPSPICSTRPARPARRRVGARSGAPEGSSSPRGAAPATTSGSTSTPARDDCGGTVRAASPPLDPGARSRRIPRPGYALRGAFLCWRVPLPPPSQPRPGDTSGRGVVAETATPGQ